MQKPMNETQPAIRFARVRKAYGDTPVLSDLTFDVPRHAFLTVIGSSGCGKTTMMKMINGLLLPDAGQVFVDGTDVSQTDRIALRRRIGYVIQSIALFPHMTIGENIAYVPSLAKGYDRKKARARAGELIESVGLSRDLLRRYPSELSGGQQQRVGIARALAGDADILLMDEPFGAVDEITRGQLQEEIKRIHLAHGVTIVFVTHDISEALRLGTRLMVMDKGQILQYDTPENVMAQPANDFVRKLVCADGRC